MSPWNFAFKTLNIFLTVINFGESELSGKPTKTFFLANFVDEILRANARNWEEKKKFLSYQDLAVRWAAALARLPAGKGTQGKKGGDKGKDSQAKTKKLPGWICKRFNEGRCDTKDDRHPAHWDPNYTLKHLCAKWMKDRNCFCLEAHPESEHK